MRRKRIRTITVVIRDDSYFDIFEGERLVTDLTWDESLGTLAVITHPQLGLVKDVVPPFSRLQHIDQHIERMVYYAKHRREMFSERNAPPALRALDEAIFQRSAAEWRAKRYATPRLLTFQST